STDPAARAAIPVRAPALPEPDGVRGHAHGCAGERLGSDAERTLHARVLVDEPGLRRSWVDVREGSLGRDREAFPGVVDWTHSRWRPLPDLGGVGRGRG